MGLLNTDLATVNGKKPRNSDRIIPGEELNFRGLLDAATNVPVVGDALSGGMALYDAAKGDYGSAAMNALGVLPFVSGTFIGKGAKTWDAVKEADALKRIKAGEDRAKVWLETGVGEAPWQKAGTEQALRGEVSDHAATITPISTLVRLRNADLVSQRNSIVSKVKESGRKPTDLEKATVNHLNELIATSAYKGKVGDVLNHPDLFAAHPPLKDRDFNWREMPIGDKGSWDQNSGMMLNQGIFGDEAKSVVLHEGQHAAQDFSGLAPGGSSEAIMRNPQNYVTPDVIEYAKSLPAYAKNDPEEFVRSFAAMRLGDPHEAYQRLAGEAEARLTQYRMNLTPQERLQQYPYDPAYFKNATGVDINDLIVRGLISE